MSSDSDSVTEYTVSQYLYLCVRIYSQTSELTRFSSVVDDYDGDDIDDDDDDRDKGLVLTCMRSGKFQGIIWPQTPTGSCLKVPKFK